ncbi:GNAT family N-acetyltransferase [Martelella endophytica]|uniref:GNAT family acetyltransferase n=1 Tax=Martelella endophytica TaxID=1486262 RepID=A0A0D5LR47_MAREN|nr:GNAT family N-acetyltransferase [Martelella endophytica]AJY46699.1 GNAT family acetyltransferase [Martelella endophytica]
MIIAETERLIIRNWEERDRALFHEINSDDRVMEFFAMRRDRAESDALLDVVRDRIAETGYGFPAVELKASGEVIGFTGLNDHYSADVKPEGVPEIGWRMATRYWGKGYASEAAKAMVDVAFNERGHDQVVAFAVANNHRSTAVMERLGMRRDPEGDFDHPSVPDTHPHLKRHVLYRLMRAD